MKKLLLLIFIQISIGAKAQVLVDTNNIWNVVECMNFGPCGTIALHFGADTTLGIHQYKILEVNTDSGGGNFAYPFAAREDTTSKQVFFSNGTNEYLAYDFSLNQGDTFITNMNGCSFQMPVDSVDTVTLLNGELRKRMFLSNLQEIWIEGIGSLFGLTYVGLNFCTADIYPELICFEENDTIKYHNSTYTSCFFTSVGISEVNKNEEFILFPNPITNELNIKTNSNQPTEITLYDITSRKLLQETFTNSTTLNTTQLTKGIYIYVVRNKNGMLKQGKVVKE